VSQQTFGREVETNKGPIKTIKPTTVLCVLHTAGSAKHTVAVQSVR
jgi:hypothetical protein